MRSLSLPLLLSFSCPSCLYIFYWHSNHDEQRQVHQLSSSLKGFLHMPMHTRSSKKTKKRLRKVATTFSVYHPSQQPLIEPTNMRKITAPSQTPTKYSPQTIECDDLFDECIQRSYQQKKKKNVPQRTSRNDDDETYSLLGNEDEDEDAIDDYEDDGEDEDDEEEDSEVFGSQNNVDHDDVCEPMHEWVKEKKSYVMCNSLHELDMSAGAKSGTLQYIASGGDRSVFRVQGDDNDNEPLALKTIIFNESCNHCGFNEENMKSSWKDGMIMAHMSSSPYVLSTFGFCGLSQVLEFADGGALDDLVSRERAIVKSLSSSTLSKSKPPLSKSKSASAEKNNSNVDVNDVALKPVDKLKIMTQMSTAIADLHDSNIAHVDLDICQWVMVNDVYKINDFHLSNLLKKNKETNEICGVVPELSESWWFLRAPEEHLHQESVIKKSDVFMLGNSMFNVLTGLWLFENTKAHQNFPLMRRKIEKGQRSSFPQHMIDSKDNAIKAMIKAIQMTWVHDVNDRPTARDVSTYLMKELRKIEENEDEGSMRDENSSTKKHEKIKVKTKEGDHHDNNAIVYVQIQDDPENFVYPDDDYFSAIE